MRKPAGLRDVAGLVATIKDPGMYADGIFMIGYPGETKSDIEDTIALSLRLGLDDATFCIVTPFPGTPLYQECLRKQYLRKGTELVDLRFAKANIRTPDLSPAYLEKKRKEAWERFHKSLVL